MTGNLRRSSRKKDRHLTHFEPDDTGSMYIWNVGNTVHIHNIQRPGSLSYKCESTVMSAVKTALQCDSKYCNLTTSWFQQTVYERVHIPF
jgi:hypothetical protein